MTESNLRKANTIDKHVGERLRKLRIEKGLSQDELAKSVDLTFQQIQKYERGQNRISSSKLFEFSRLLNTEISYFFDNLNDDAYNFKNPVVSSSLSNNKEEYEISSLDLEVEQKELFAAYTKIKDKKVRESLLKMAKTLAKSSD